MTTRFWTATRMEIMAGVDYISTLLEDQPEVSGVQLMPSLSY
jgi:hypothetical protein